MMTCYGPHLISPYYRVGVGTCPPTYVEAVAVAS